MLRVRTFIFVVVFVIGTLFLSLFTTHYKEDKLQSATLITQIIRANLSNISYDIYKNLKNIENVKKFKVLFDRVKASNDMIQDILLSDGNKILLNTNYRNATLPTKESYYIPNTMSKLKIIEMHKIYHTKTFIYDKSRKLTLDLFIILDPEEVNNYISNQTNLLWILFFIALFTIALVYFIINKIIVVNLEKLRQYAYYQSELPKKFMIKELESIRYSMFQTFSRLETERKELYQLARTDSLSGLANREHLHERLELLLSVSKRDNKEFALLFLDLDHFKNVNDSLGHHIGDLLLQEIAGILKKVLRENEIIARVGGDEFIIVLSYYKSNFELTQIIDRIQETLQTPFIIKEKIIEISSSIGIAMYPKDGLDEVELIKNADIAMYKAKDDGRSRYHFFTQKLHDKLQEEIQIHNEMRQALKNGEFEMYYQPKTDVQSGAIVGCESLIRWNHPIKGLISPFHFIDIAEKNGFIVELGKWVLEVSIKQQVTWRDEGVCDIPISINASVKQLLHKGFLQHLQELIGKYKVNPAKVDIEIVESVFLLHSKQNTDILSQIHSLGCTISLDDFGTGYSSLSYLKDFKVDTLKIDKVFVDDFDSKNGSIFLETIIKMGQTLQLKVLCEGVETEEQLHYLQKLDCELYQGYLCSKPIPSKDFAQLYLNQKKEKTID